MDQSYEFQDLILAWLASQPTDVAFDWTLQEWAEMLRRRGIGPKQFLRKAPWPSGAVTAPIADWGSELHSLIGLAAVKTQILQIRNFLRVRKLRRSLGLRTDSFSLHQAFLGNPGTGKTSVARILAGIYHELGVLPRANVLEVSRDKLVGQYIGATEARTSQAIDEALGGVLFIDEAYALARGGSEDFGRVAIDVLVKAMEDHRDHLVVIVAGYTQKMATFFDSNPGLLARFPRRIHFPDYTDEELVRIFERMASNADFTLSDDAARFQVRSQLTSMKVRNGSMFGNARDVRNLWEAVELEHADRIAKEFPEESQAATIPRERLCGLSSADIPEFAESQITLSP
ncbi:stage V sporulation protein K [Bradyrhizobium sp. LB7.1]